MANVEVLVDTNVVIDWLNDRKPWSDAAQPFWQSRDAGLIDLYQPTSVLTDIVYILRKPLGTDGAKAAIEKCTTTFGLLPVDEVVVQSALALPGSDFEDLDFEFLYDDAYDGIEKADVTAEMGIVYLAFGDWFKRFGSPANSNYTDVHPFAREDLGPETTSAV